MYNVEPRITINVECGSSRRRTEVSVPWNVLRFLDAHAERTLTTDGDVVYRLARAAQMRSLRAMGPSMGNRAAA